MTRDVSRFLAPDFLSLTIGIVVYFVGVLTTQRVKFLRNFSIPEPVSGGFIAVVVVSLIYFVFNLEIDFDLTTRDRLLVIFFATVGINARLADLVAGGRTLLVLCVICSGVCIHSEYRRHRWRTRLRHALCSGGGHRLPSLVRRPWDHHRLGPPH